MSHMTDAEPSLQRDRSLKGDPHIIVAMSGGVDSSVAAALLLEQGYSVAGMFMKNWEEADDEQYCSASQDLADATAVCHTLGIKLHTVNFSSEYWDRVFEHFLKEYQAGRTPNPDILCNKEIKFRAFLDYAKHLGADKIATGHYARILQDQAQWQLHKARDLNKDQSYFLYTLNQQQLAQSLFPLGHYHKPEIRKMAESLGFINYAKKDSTGICFIGERKFRTFLQQYLPAKPGDIVTDTGCVIGQHEGLMYYTLGQRKGIGLGGVAGYPEAPWFVLAKDLSKNRLVVGQGESHPLLLSKALLCRDLHWISGELPGKSYACQAKTRYRQPDQTCQLALAESPYHRVDFDNDQRAVTPGQAIVFYQDSQCLGGATIDVVMA